MSYAASFHRLVMIGDLYTDVFNMSLSIVPNGGTGMPAVTDALLADVAADVGAWFPKSQQLSLGGGLSISGSAKLTSIKLNRINSAGHYQDPGTKEHVYPTPIPGVSSSTTIAPQLSIAATLRGANERALAGRGRFYPPITLSSSAVASDGRLAVTATQYYAYGVMSLINAINDSYLSAGVNALVGIASRSGAGAFQSVQKVSVGRVVDTMRSRRNKLAEDPFELAI